MATVQRELKAGTDVNLGIADMGPANILYIPGGVLLMAADISTIVLAVGTLGQYFYVVKAIGDPNRPFLLQKMRATPLDAALDAGHYDIASLLREHGGEATYSRHYHGDYSQDPTDRPRIPAPQQKSNTPAKQKTAPRASDSPTPAEPLPRIGGAAGGISAH